MDADKSGYVGSKVDLRCRFLNSVPPVKISQVTWQKVVNGSKQNVAIANPSLGVSVALPYRDRVAFKNVAVRRRTPALEDTTLTFSALRLADAAAYICEYTTFPAGNREGTVNLTVYARPTTQMSLSTPTLVARASNVRTPVATCTSANGKPPGNIREFQNPDGTFTVQSEYALVPNKDAHQETLTCVSTYNDEEVFTDSVTLDIQCRENVQLSCQADANPAVTLYTWKLVNGTIPSSVEVQENTLTFRGPLTYDLEGTYACDATNSIGTGSASVAVSVIEKPLPLVATGDVITVIALLLAAGVLVGITITVLVLKIRSRKDSNSTKSPSGKLSQPVTKTPGDDLQHAGKFYEELPNTADYVSYRLACNKENYQEPHSPPTQLPLSFLPQQPYQPPADPTPASSLPAPPAAVNHAASKNTFSPPVHTTAVFKYPSPPPGAGSPPPGAAPYTFPKEHGGRTSSHHGNMVVPLTFLTLLRLLLGPTATGANVVTILNPGDPGAVVYDDAQVYGVVNMAVILECGGTLPDIYIWGFTRLGTDESRSVVYNLGNGPRVQPLATALGSLTVISHSAALSINRLPRAAEGLYTCQAFYETPRGPESHYYYVRLTVRVPVSKPYVLLSDASPVEGSVVVLRCGLGNGTAPVLYVWEHQRQGTPAATIAQGNSSMLIMSNVNRNNTGWYRCVVSNAVNLERSDRALMDVVYGPDIPQIDVTPYSVTERGYSALERDTVLLLCQAQSNPPSQYTWYYNNSQVNGGSSFIINKILRTHTGKYACLAHNTQLDTSSIRTINLTVYYPPDGSPSCSVEPVLNHSSLSLQCSWPGGLPAPSLHWTRGLVGLGQEVAGPGREIDKPSNNVTLLPVVARTSNNTLFTCLGSHPARNHTTYCSMRTYSPPAEPVCSAYATRNNQYLMLSCSWNGGVPRALLWWAGPGGGSGGQPGEESSNRLVLRHGIARNGQAYTCHAQHPLLAQPQSCRLTL
ncbi:hypothetical protein NHX12_009532, partial [Muraenolepis orangiensis]